MRRNSWRSMAWLVLVVLGAGGCSDVREHSAETGGVKTYDRDKLPKTTQELPPLDQGRLEVPTPKDWQWRSQEKGILARFHLKGRSGIPQIIIKLDSEFSPEIKDVTADNVAAYAELVHGQLDQQGTKYLESAKPLLLGQNGWARYVMVGKLPGKQVATIERQILKTTRGGRTYTVELQVPAKELVKYRDSAYALAAGMVFSAEGAPKPDAPAPKTNEADTKDSDTKPAEPTEEK